MGLKQKIKELGLPKLALEAILIFSSVYAAFVLEDRRSKNFERQILRDKLTTHLKVMKLDSGTFEARLGTSTTVANIGLEASIENHKRVLDLLEEGSEKSKMSAYQIHRDEKLFWRIIQSETKSQHQLESILENYEHLLVNDSTLFWLKKYIYHTWVINQFASWADANIDKINDFGYDNYFVLTKNEKKEDILDYVSQPLYYNGIKQHLDWILALKQFKKEYDQDYNPIREAILKEIEAQNQHL